MLDDEVARWSGDKFLVFLPETTLEQGILAAEKRDRLLKNS
ncbi:nucleotidyl cyclase domain-containing protein [Paraglaciecola psychrophila]|uniref:GGDEF domain-containing protein n=1 Tax=Paraglaciecola psychrophila 170 TaxID=1129794 RepID=K7A739_9ALTE|nr:diguanylate cyclase [Paraglaciecola psychrophila]AGH45477.1 hypothetical protein C427_3368 [Paraglaciecola psychrophila 170]GAC38142.1 hypothetical protein GPSY_2528 [Paraglaciecola psychrophila 170]